MVGVDPAGASLDVARRKPYADRVTWLAGDATSLPRLQGDLASMTASVAQVFETRDPSARAWLEWTRDQTGSRVVIPGVGPVETWCDVTSVVGSLVTFRWTHVFASDGAVVTSDSTLRFRSRAEVERSSGAAGFVVDDVRDAPDRPGRELVFVASRR